MVTTEAGTKLDIVLDDVDSVISATQQVRLAEQSLKPGALVAGAYYRGHLGNTETVGRWNGQQYRFVVWVQEKGSAKLKGARHVLESGIGDAFAPFAIVQVAKEQQISDYDLAMVR
ncbi:MAG TPA: hypothetical protein VHB46_11065 [Burkholderiales bacterium]|nr:hypothetical protein [Burkholderiales bacterium]